MKMSGSEGILESGGEILKNIVSIGKNVTIYPPNHPLVIEPASAICELLKPIFQESAHLNISVVNSEVYVERHLLREESIKHEEFIRLLEARGINNITFDPSVTPESVGIFFQIVCGKNKPDGSQSIDEMFKQMGGRGISIDTLVAIDPAKEAYEFVGEQSESARTSYDSAIDCMESLEHDVLENKPINEGALHGVVSTLMADFLDDRDAVMAVLSLRNYDEHLFHHSVNVAVVCLLMANELAFSQELTRTVGIAALLHDTGKIKTPREILEKPGRLTADEWLIMEKHTVQGAQILMRYEGLGELAVLAALEHHMGYDLSGYPQFKKKGRPHVLSRIVSIADAYEALTANRAYRAAQSVQIAVGVLLDGAGKKFDPLLVKLLLNKIGVFPPGSVVNLKNGQTAVVVEPGEENPYLPKVRLIGEGDNGDGDIIHTFEDPAQYAIASFAETA